jgi:hypothetical protein
MKLSNTSRVKLKRLSAKLLVVGLAVAAGVWMAGRMIPSIKASSGRLEAIVLDAQTKADQPMWDPRDPKVVAALTEPGRQRQLEAAVALNRHPIETASAAQIPAGPRRPN